MLAAVVTMAVVVRVDPGGTPPAPLPDPAESAVPSPDEENSALPSPGQPPAIDPSVPRELGTWAVDVPKALIATPAEHVGVWTGEALVVGFEEEVAAFDVASRTWRTLPDHPHGHAEGRQVVWTGREIVVIGGVNQAECDPPLGCPTSAMALDPTSGRWRTLPTEPGMSPAPDALIWTGKEAIVLWGGITPGPQNGDYFGPLGSAYDPQANTWRFIHPLHVAAGQSDDLPDPRTRAGGQAINAVWTGRQVVVWGTEKSPAFGATYDPSTDLWQSVPFPDTTAAQEGIWTDEQLIVFEEEGAPFGYVIHPGDDSSAALPDVPGLEDPRTSIYGGSVVWTGERVLFYGGYSHSAFLAWEPTSSRWIVHNPDRARLNGVAAWTGHELLLWGGYTTTGPDVDVAIWTPPPTDTE